MKIKISKRDYRDALGYKIVDRYGEISSNAAYMVQIIDLKRFKIKNKKNNIKEKIK